MGQWTGRITLRCKHQVGIVARSRVPCQGRPGAGKEPLGGLGLGARRLPQGRGLLEVGVATGITITHIKREVREVFEG